ncbi:Methionine aminopeptidase [Buchnera aphidicola (Pterocallis alni)]|uniref:type I methionyl aminopeptidase n=1 Tax=Buchnera aphidicola TaxID=9 RepID=UPI0034647294
MNIYINTKYDIKKMKIASYIAKSVLEMIKPYVVPNITTQELNDICHEYIINKHNALPACLGYHGFPKSTCISVNEIICHGIPNKKKKLQNGDIVNIDITIVKDKYYADTSKMFIVGQPSTLAKKLCKVAKKSLYITFPIIKPGMLLNKIGRTIQKYINKTPFSIVEEYCGHGIGKNMHEIPYILHYNNNKKIILQEGMIFTIEPIINAGTKNVISMEDGWSVRTQDYNLSAQYEHTILVNKKGCEILTKRTEEKIQNIYVNN